MEHTCRKGGKPVGYMEGPAWASPGEIVKLADEQNWGRIALRWRCCDSYTVALAEFGDQAAELRDAQPVDAFENAWHKYPDALPPVGYPLVKAWPSTKVEPFGGRVAYRIAPHHGG